MASRKPAERRDPKELDRRPVTPPRRDGDADGELDVFDAPTEIIERRVNTVPDTTKG